MIPLIKIDIKIIDGKVVYLVDPKDNAGEPYEAFNGDVLYITGSEKGKLEITFHAQSFDILIEDANDD